MQKYNEIHQLIEWCNNNLRAASLQISINNILIYTQPRIISLDDELCERILSTHKGIYEVFVYTDELNVWSGVTYEITQSVPFDHIRLFCDKNTNSITVAFKEESIHFPDSCFFTKTGVFDYYTISNHNFNNLASMPTIDADVVLISNCSFPNKSLQGLNFKLVNRFTIEYCNVEDLGNGVSSFSGMDFIIWDTEVKLKSWKGLPTTISKLMIGTYSDSEEEPRNGIDGPTTVSYDPNLLRTLPKYLTKCKTLTLPFPADGTPVPILNVLLIECDELELTFSKSKEQETFSVASIVKRHFDNKRLRKKDHSTVVMECQEELIEMGLSKYAKI